MFPIGFLKRISSNHGEFIPHFYTFLAHGSWKQKGDPFIFNIPGKKGEKFFFSRSMKNKQGRQRNPIISSKRQKANLIWSNCVPKEGHSIKINWDLHFFI